MQSGFLSYLDLMQKGCLNCGGLLLPGQKYCPSCGQKANTRRLTFQQLLYDFAQSIISTEKGIRNLVTGLAIHPGKVAAEYAAGKRKKYFNPFTFMGLCVALMILLNTITRPYTTEYYSDPAVLARIPDPAVKQLYLQAMEKMNYVIRFTNRNMNTLTVLISPWFAFFLWMFFKKRERNMAEITTAHILFSAFSNLVTAILLNPFLGRASGTNLYYPVLAFVVTAQTLYITWGMKYFLRVPGTAGFLRIFLVSALAGLAGFLIIMVLYFFYVYGGEASGVLKYL